MEKMCKLVVSEGFQKTEKEKEKLVQRKEVRQLKIEKLEKSIREVGHESRKQSFKDGIYYDEVDKFSKLQKVFAEDTLTVERIIAEEKKIIASVTK